MIIYSLEVFVVIPVYIYFRIVRELEVNVPLESVAYVTDLKQSPPDVFFFEFTTIERKWFWYALYVMISRKRL